MPVAQTCVGFKEKYNVQMPNSSCRLCVVCCAVCGRVAIRTVGPGKQPGWKSDGSKCRGPIWSGEHSFLERNLAKSQQRLLQKPWYQWTVMRKLPCTCARMDNHAGVRSICLQSE